MLLADASPAARRCLVVSDNALHSLTLEYYVSMSRDLCLVASLCDGVEAYDFLHGGGEVDLVIMDLSSAGLSAADMQAVTRDGRPCWLLIEEMGNLLVFGGGTTADRPEQPLSFRRFGQLVEQALAPLALAEC